MEKILKKTSQEQKVLEVLQKKNGGWVNYRYFLQTMMLSQAHCRIFNLQRKGYRIEASEFRDEFGFKSYRLLTKETLF